MFLILCKKLLQNFAAPLFCEILELRYLRQRCSTVRLYSSGSPVLSVSQELFCSGVYLREIPSHWGWIILTTYLFQWLEKGAERHQITYLILQVVWYIFPDLRKHKVWNLDFKNYFLASLLFCKIIKHCSCCVKFSILFPWPLASIHITLHSLSSILAWVCSAQPGEERF